MPHRASWEIEFDATSVVLAIGTYTYTDEDRNPTDTITWDLSGTDETHFEIGSTSGDLSFKERPNFEMPVDMGSGNDYVIVVEADDGQSGVGTYQRDRDRHERGRDAGDND